MKPKLNQAYQPGKIEEDWYKHWEKNGYFRPTDEGQPYCIVLPPPNVTGSLHMGHGFQHTLMDVLIRHQRMRGRKVLWQGGVDHAGIATQMVVERQLEGEGKSKEELGREEFVKRVWQWKKQSGGTINAQMRRLGVSIDWDRSRFTLDEGFSYAVQKAFIQFYEEGLIYRGKKLVNWDPVLKTAVSDLEVASEEESGHLWHFRYPLKEKQGYLVVATTRPETMFGDTAVAVNPEDARYSHLIGESVLLPLSERELPIIADDYVDSEFGTGCVKITPAHDFNDYAIGQKHNLETINIFDDGACLNHTGAVPEKYRGLDRYKARKKIIQDLDTKGLLEKTEPHKFKVPRGDRTRAVLEPRLTDQWFLRAPALAKSAIQAVEKAEICFVPDNWKNTYYNWMNNIQDWCISRQLWWGHRIPVWYDEAGNSYAGHDEEDVKKRNTLDKDARLTQEQDVLDTWFSSALWSFGSLGWPQKKQDVKIWHPTSVLITGFDIIFFWVARMIMASFYFLKEPPFKDVYVTGLILDAKGEKMSKSKGNILDPIDLMDGINLEDLVKKRCSDMMQPQLVARIEKETRKTFPEGIKSYGADALRFTYCALASTTRSIRFDMGRVDGYRNFCNKLWNASRYVIDNVDTPPSSEKSGVYNHWICQELDEVASKLNKYLEEYRFDLVAATLYDFLWHEYCDWYLELSKLSIDKESTRYTLVQVLEKTLRLLHPIMPFITEEIWQRLKPISNADGDSIMLASYPAAVTGDKDPQVESEMAFLKSVVSAIRNVRGNFDIPSSKKLTVWVADQDNSEHYGKIFDKHHSAICSLGKLAQLRWAREEISTPVITEIADGVTVMVELDGVIDPAEEIGRLEKRIAKLEKQLFDVLNKLNNRKFAEKAPKELIEKTAKIRKDTENSLQKLKEQLKVFRLAAESD